MYNFFIYVQLFILLCFVKTNANKVGLKKCSKIWSRINLPSSHMPYFFHSNENLRLSCLADESCPYKSQAHNDSLKCWGYENKCDLSKRLFLPKCPDDSRGWTTDKQTQIQMFWEQVLLYRL
jgi:hypothetical protein